MRLLGTKDRATVCLWLEEFSLIPQHRAVALADEWSDAEQGSPGAWSYRAEEHHSGKGWAVVAYDEDGARLGAA